VLAAFLALLVYGLAARAPNSTIDDALAGGEAVVAPGFTMDVLDPGRVPEPLASKVEQATEDGLLGLEELRGTPLVLNVWASWCVPCREEAPVLEAAWRRAAPEGVLFLGLDLQDNPDDARAFLRQYDITYPNLRERGKATFRRYDATGVPETFFVSASGRVVFHVVGVVTAAGLRRGVAAARADRVVAAARGGAQGSAR
jgi:cytochrome c biogenesis protein CcmG, thiol:disulfide interchange protein DsbE